MNGALPEDATVFMFPGQSSKYPDMFERLASQAPEQTREVLGLASEILERDLAAHYRADNPAIFASNCDVQLGVFLASHVHLVAAERAGLRARLSLGLSLGEYNHLVHIGALDFADAVRLVSARGDAYEAGPPGAMASVFPLEGDDVQAVLKRVRAMRPWVIEVANLNSPTQCVIAGDAQAIAAAGEIFEREHGVEPIMIEPRIAMHSSLFAPVAEVFSQVVSRVPFRAPKRPYLPNVTGQLEPDPTPDRIRALLTAHVISPVRFRHSIELLASLAPRATFVEVGPRSVLYNLLSRKWLSNRRLRTDTPEGPLALAAAQAVAS